MTEIILTPLHPDDREQFISDNQKAFNYGALEEFGRRDDHFEEEGEIISRDITGIRILMTENRSSFSLRMWEKWTGISHSI